MAASESGAPLKLSPLERAVLLRTLDEREPELRAQLEHRQVVSREWTGVGFFTEFEVDRSAAEPHPTSERFHLGDVSADLPELRNGAGFVLFVQDGYLEMLEGYTFDEPWPEKVTTFELRAMARADLPGRPWWQCGEKVFVRAVFGCFASLVAVLVTLGEEAAAAMRWIALGGPFVVLLVWIAVVLIVDLWNRSQRSG